MPEQTHTITPALFSQNLQAKGKTYFFDVKEARNGSKYLSITESWIKDGLKHRGNITVFPDQIEEFNQAFAQTQEKLK